MKFISGWQTIIKTKEGNIEMYVDENYLRVDLTWNVGIDWKLIQSKFIN